ncbi:MAG: hypothetical protein V4623_03675 [Pseudomonadota bacterium]
MKIRRLLYLSSHQMTVFHWESGVLHRDGQFEFSSEGQQKFAAYLSQTPRSIFTLLVNVPEEGFQIESIPFLRGANRQMLIKRRFGQLFFSATLTSARSLGYEKTRRKNERVLFSALTNNLFFEPWLKAISNARVIFSGIYSLPLLGSALLKKIGIDEARCLLLTVQDQSIRQSYFEHGELCFSRLTPLHHSSIAGVAQALAAEALKLQQYLSSQRMIGRNHPINAYVLAQPSALNTVLASCVSTDTLHFKVLSLDVCTRKIGLKTQLQDLLCEPLFLHLLATTPSLPQFANESQRHEYHLWQVRSGLYRASVLGLIASLAFSAYQLYETDRIKQATELLKIDARTAKQRYEEIAKTFPPIQTDNETLRRVMNRYAELERNNVVPDDLYQAISRALQSSPSVELEEIDWQLGAAVSELPSNAQTRPLLLREAPAMLESAVISGMLKLPESKPSKPAKSTPRQILTAFQQFIDALEERAQAPVVVLQRPFDVESGKSLKATDTALDEGKPRSFSVRISRKIAQKDAS